MSFQILWFILAGFILGFAASTLWEWLYYRPIRLQLRDRRIVDLENEVRRLEAMHPYPDDEAENRPSAGEQMGSISPDPAYTSPNIRLESEQRATDIVPFDEAPFDEAPFDAEQPLVAPVSPATYAETADLPPVSTLDSPTPFEEEPSQRYVSADEPYASARPDPAGEMGVFTEADDAVAEEHFEQQRSADDEYIPHKEDGAEYASGIATTNEAAANEVPMKSNWETDDAERAVRLAAERAATIAGWEAEEYQQLGEVAGMVEQEPQSAPQHPTLKPVVYKRSRGYPDDLTRINGIGARYMRRLYEANIFTWHQVGKSDVERLRQITAARLSANVDEWPAQAAELAEQNDRVGATYQGPIPDNFTQINGIGAAYARQLYQAGICSFRQLAAAHPPDIYKILKAPPVGEGPNVQQWQQQARTLMAQS